MRMTWYYQTVLTEPLNLDVGPTYQHPHPHPESPSPRQYVESIYVHRLLTHTCPSEWLYPLRATPAEPPGAFFCRRRTKILTVALPKRCFSPDINKRFPRRSRGLGRGRRRTAFACNGASFCLPVRLSLSCYSSSHHRAPSLSPPFFHQPSLLLLRLQLLATRRLRPQLLASRRLRPATLATHRFRPCAAPRRLRPQLLAPLATRSPTRSLPSPPPRWRPASGGMRP